MEKRKEWYHPPVGLRGGLQGVSRESPGSLQGVFGDSPGGLWWDRMGLRWAWVGLFEGKGEIKAKMALLGRK